MIVVVPRLNVSKKQFKVKLLILKLNNDFAKVLAGANLF